MEQAMELGGYFDRIAIIHLPERKDRFRALSRELRTLDIDIAGPKVDIPHAPRPGDAHGFPSRGVYGNFLSHLSILRRARDEGLRNVWVLEDDAIFSRRMRRTQGALVDNLRNRDWDLCFFGYSLTAGSLAGKPDGLVPSSAEFIWAHCYAVHARILPRLVAHLEQAIELPQGHPAGGKLYIDAAFTLFRRHNPDVVSLLANPVLSVQKGSVSSLVGGNWYDKVSPARPLVAAARGVRDQWWRWRA